MYIVLYDMYTLFLCVCVYYVWENYKDTAASQNEREIIITMWGTETLLGKGGVNILLD
jgi:hypothetical protein